MADIKRYWMNWAENCMEDHAEGGWVMHSDHEAAIKAAVAAEREALTTKIALAYGHLWHVNNEPAAPIPIYTPEKAAYEARKILRDTLTSEQRGDAINATQQVWGSVRGAAHE